LIFTLLYAFIVFFLLLILVGIGGSSLPTYMKNYWRLRWNGNFKVKSRGAYPMTDDFSAAISSAMLDFAFDGRKIEMEQALARAFQLGLRY